MNKNLFSHQYFRYSIFIISMLIGVFVLNTLEDLSTTQDYVGKKVSQKSFTLSQMRFEKNLGQSNSEASFLFQDQAIELELSSTKAVMCLRQPFNKNKTNPKKKDVSVIMSFVNANPSAKGEGLDELITKSNYFIGNDQAKWRKNIPNYQKVQFSEIYHGIDLVYYGNAGKLEYDFNISPGADPSKILLQFQKEAESKLDKNGDLVLKVGDGLVTMQAPLAFQNVEEARTHIETKFAQQDELTYGFEIGEYDESKTLIIDPILVYSTFLGISGTGEDIVVDEDGFAYIVGSDGTNAFVTKLHPDSSVLIYSTIIGGDLEDFGLGIAVDTAGYVYVTGETQSGDFPTLNAIQPDLGGDLWIDSDAYISKLDPYGSLVYSTYLGGEGNDIGYDIAVDLSGNAYITGKTISWEFPVENAYQDSLAILDIFTWGSDAFVSKLNSDGSAFIFSTYLGGGGGDEGRAITLDINRNIYLAGQTGSSDYYITPGAYQTELTVGGAFITKMNAQGTDIVFSTFLTGGNDPNFSNVSWGTGIAVNEIGEVYVVGETFSPDFPDTNAVQPKIGGAKDGFVTKFSADGSSLVFSTFLGGTEYEQNLKIALDSEGNAFVTGKTNSTNFPIEQFILYDVNSKLNELNGHNDAFVTAISSDGKDFIFSSYLGGSGWDQGRGIALWDNTHIFVTGQSNSTDFPLVSPLQSGSNSVFVTEIEIEEKEDTLVVEVLQDSLKHEPAPVANTELDIFLIDHSKLQDPFVYLGRETTDNEGLLHLPSAEYEPGKPFLLTTKLTSLPAVKQGHEMVDDVVYDIYVDNLNIDKTGKIRAAFLEPNKNDTTHTYLEHTWVGFNLVVSIEWEASDEYIRELKSAFLNASNYLYDIANGHACLQNIAIYDNGSQWDNADIRIHANNREWPRTIINGYKWEMRGYVKLPPQSFGSAIDNINRVYDEPLTPDNYINYYYIIHELGHYFFGFYDEYISATRELIFPDTAGTQPKINFGFMDDGRIQQDQMSSEMSAFETAEYTNTAQYSKRNSACWEYFRTNFRNIEGMVRAEIHTPKLLGLNSNEIVEGPLSNELGVGNVLDIIDKTGPDGGPRLEYFAKNENGQPCPGVYIASYNMPSDNHPRGRFVREGLTVLSGPNRGRIRLFTAKPGDELFFSLTEKPTNFLFLKTIVQATGSQLSKKNSEVTLHEVILKTVQGKFKLLSEVKFLSSGELEYNTRTQSNFNNLPTLQIIEDDNAVKDFSLTSESYGYTTTIPGDIGQKGAVCMFKAPDSSGTLFFVPQDLNILVLDENSNHLVPSQNSIEMWFEYQNLTKLAIMGSNFPAPTTGLPDSVMRASNVFAINQQPINEMINSNIRIFYDADTLGAANPQAVTIYHWNDEWQPMPTKVNMDLSYASTKIEEPGFYAAYLDLTQSVILTSIKDEGIIEQDIPKGFELYHNYPNPFNPSTTIKYSVANVETGYIPSVQLKVYDILGREIITLVNKEQSQGYYEVKFDGSDLTSGIYFFRLQSGDYVETKKMILLK
jgi:Secretion system C-terminal sorting domain/Beta-propeller repeat